MKNIQIDGLWLIGIGVALISSDYYNYNLLTIIGTIMAVRGLVGIIYKFVKKEKVSKTSKVAEQVRNE